jgi:tRNA threonylcarbamoyladenosine biosynthesis protein TsaE
VARGLDVPEPVVSPTFMIMREYEGRHPLAHIDVYRLDRFQELHDLGFDEMLEDRVTLVEWGDVAEPLLPADRLEVRLVATGDEEREITVAGHGETWAARSRGLAEIFA